MKKGAIILCGGESSRMGQDKATLPFGPELMLPRVVRLLSEVVDQNGIVIVAASNQCLPTLPAEVIIARDRMPNAGLWKDSQTGIGALPSTSKRLCHKL